MNRADRNRNQKTDVFLLRFTCTFFTFRSRNSTTTGIHIPGTLLPSERTARKTVHLLQLYISTFDFRNKHDSAATLLGKARNVVAKDTQLSGCHWRQTGPAFLPKIRHPVKSSHSSSKVHNPIVKETSKPRPSRL